MATKKSTGSSSSGNSTSPKSNKKADGGSADPSDTAKFEKQIVAEANKREPPTYIRGKILSPNLEARSYVDTYAYYRDKDSDKPPILITGNDSQIALQASLLNAFDVLLDQRGGTSNLDFEAWITQFENGFSSFTEGASAELLKQWQKKEAWPGVAVGNRPKVVELKQPGNVKDKYKVQFKVAQLFPNRDDKNAWIIFYGVDYADLANQIINWWNQKTGEAGDVSGGKRFTPTMVGQPLITVRFRNTATNDRGEKLIRIMDKTDSPFSNLPKLSHADIRQYGNKILEQFNGYIWKKGKEVTSYKGVVPRRQGIDGWAYRTSEATGIDLFTRLAAVAGVTLDKRYLKHSQTEDESNAYPQTPRKAVILGKERELPLQRPVVDVKFSSASIKLNSLGIETYLVKNGKMVYEDL